MEDKNIENCYKFRHVGEKEYLSVCITDDGKLRGVYEKTNEEI